MTTGSNLVRDRENARLVAYILEGTCRAAYGFEGRETFPNCGACVYCRLLAASTKNNTPGERDEIQNNDD